MLTSSTAAHSLDRLRPSSTALFITLAAALSPCSSSALAQLASFQPLGDLPGGQFRSSASGISADGTTVVGQSVSGSGPEAFRWTAGTLTPLGDLAGGPFESIAIATNSDGSVIVGRGRSATNDRAVRWVNGTISQLPQVPGYDGGSTATGISPDGSVVFGYNTNNFIYAYTGVIGFRLEGGTLIGLTDIAGGRIDTATGNGPTSRDGMIIPGRGVNASNFYQACYWNGASLVELPSLPGGGGAVF